MLHRHTCMQNRESMARLAAIPHADQEFSALRRWMLANICVLQHLAQQELGVRSDPERGAHVFFSLVVRMQPRETDRAKKFTIMQAVPHPIADMGPHAPSISLAYETVHPKNRERGRGTYLIVAVCDSNFLVPCILPVGFVLGTSMPFYPPAALIALINIGGKVS